MDPNNPADTSQIDQMTRALLGQGPGVTQPGAAGMPLPPQPDPQLQGLLQGSQHNFMNPMGGGLGMGGQGFLQALMNPKGNMGLLSLLQGMGSSPGMPGTPGTQTPSATPSAQSAPIPPQ